MKNEGSTMPRDMRFLGCAFGLFALALHFAAPAAGAYDSAPIGWASVNDLGQNGTTGGAGGTVVTATTSAELLDYALREGPYIIQVSGTINLTGECLVASNKTIIGVGANPTVAGKNFRTKGTYNVIFRNLVIRNTGDGISVQHKPANPVDIPSHHVWIDHCEFFNCSDGCIDITHGPDYVTVSWCIFHRHGTTSRGTLLGHSNKEEWRAVDGGHLKVTYHHNWFETHQRNPRVRFSGLCHVFNNYYDQARTPLFLYGVASNLDAQVLVEGNYFKDVPYPSIVGYSGEPPGNLVERHNVYDNCGAPQTRNVAPTVPEPSLYYAYALDPAADVQSIVTQGAGLFKAGPTSVSHGQSSLY